MDALREISGRSFSTSPCLSEGLAFLQGDEAYVYYGVDAGETFLMIPESNMLKTQRKLWSLGRKQRILSDEQNTGVNHKSKKTIAMFQFIYNISDDYRFFLRGHHPALAFERVLYALPSKRGAL
ncbi:UNVERIFIED_ORG: hypothetical protein J2806_003894 [Kosakonia oryzae]|uniref:hypothetical protein n=1 Tax=Kosakonia radicincitans TaxID=283686 RepID=UPI00116023C9|nr:hypothetical protein [Kosakonia radicincitans]MDP9568218.1 hypothetical protein [Kosakonia oryzae]